MKLMKERFKMDCRSSAILRFNLISTKSAKPDDIHHRHICKCLIYAKFVFIHCLSLSIHSFYCIPFRSITIHRHICKCLIYAKFVFIHCLSLSIHSFYCIPFRSITIHRHICKC
eukprot:916987_1